MAQPPLSPFAAKAVLDWYGVAGVDECIGEAPQRRYDLAPKAKPAAPPKASPKAPSDNPFQTPKQAEKAVQAACALAGGASDLGQLRQALTEFDGCALKLTATNLVFGDGEPSGGLMLVGEAPGAEEDRQGVPFVGASGRLLDRMLASIGRDRTSAYITNIVFWRPPGNRNPTTAEIAACLPFVERHIELVDPRVLVALGGPAAKTLLGQAKGITKLRGTWHSYATPNLARPVPTMALFHPAYLLRSPAQKQKAWRDLLAIKAKLAED